MSQGRVGSRTGARVDDNYSTDDSARYDDKLAITGARNCRLTAQLMAHVSVPSSKGAKVGGCGRVPKDPTLEEIIMVQP